MGAYYMGTIITDNEAKRYCTHSTGNGLKLMEHSYLENNYCKHIVSLLKDNPQKLIWLCDYHEPDDITKCTWNNTEEVEKYDVLDLFKDNKYYIYNHTKKLYIDVKRLLKLYEDSENSSWSIHPLPILCNSDTGSQGGGDMHREESRRASWCEDIISSSEQLVDGFEDVTEDVLFFE